MSVIEPGRVCIKVRGRDAGSKCIIMKVIDDNFAEVLSAGRKRPRKVNVAHLEITNQSVDLSDEASVKRILS
ncbi:MAG: KOW motif-containing protein [Candidatus Micrarchaeia archaeon]